MRSEFGAAQISMILANVNSKRGGFKLHDFAPYHNKPDDSPIDLQTAMRDWQ